MRSLRKYAVIGIFAAAALPGRAAALEPARSGEGVTEAASYLIGPGDDLQVFVWRNPELSAQALVRPDGKITAPLVQDIQAQGKTPSQLAADLKVALSNYIQDPIVTVLVKAVAAPRNSAAIRVIGAAVTPKTVPYNSGLTLLDVLIEVGGLNTFASGNRAVLLRRENGGFRSYRLRLDDLVRGGKLNANMNLEPGDVIRIPERWF
ncbi:MAG: polysaccharide export protein [Caulobacteraceae bacterium]|nr:polysaccharide export protein [Caulobacteraceae bacterium]